MVSKNTYFTMVCRACHA